MKNSLTLNGDTVSVWNVGKMNLLSRSSKILYTSSQMRGSHVSRLKSEKTLAVVSL